jgi:hypothetical protein
MKKTLPFLALLALAYFGHQWLVNRPKTEPKKEAPSPSAPAGTGAGVAGMHGIVAPDVAQGTAPAAPAAPAPAVPEATFVCTQSVDAFDPAQPSQQIGSFQAGSVLKLGNADAASGKIAVAFQGKNGNVIRALCRPEDVGKQATATAVAQPPAAPAAPGGRPTTMSTFKNRIKKLGEGN